MPILRQPETVVTTICNLTVKVSWRMPPLPSQLLPPQFYHAYKTPMLFDNQHNCMTALISRSIKMVLINLRAFTNFMDRFTNLSWTPINLTVPEHFFLLKNCTLPHLQKADRRRISVKGELYRLMKRVWSWRHSSDNHRQSSRQPRALFLITWF